MRRGIGDVPYFGFGPSAFPGSQKWDLLLIEKFSDYSCCALRSAVPTSSPSQATPSNKKLLQFSNDRVCLDDSKHPSDFL